MSSRFLSVLAGVALVASATSAFAFDAVLSSPKALHTHPWHRSGVIEVLPATAVINIIGCRHGWCEATAANGATGFVYTPVLVGAVPAPGWWYGWGAWSVAEPVRTGGLFGFGLFDGIFGGPEPVAAPAPVVASY